jgi:hypothetical protein
MTLTLSDVMSAIYECEVNCSLSSDWDGGWRVTIGGSQHRVCEASAFVDTPVQAANWLHARAIERYPEYEAWYAHQIIVAHQGFPHGPN